MSTTTIAITGDLSLRTSRIALKRTMTTFGEVDACHMGDRAVMGDRFTEFPIVRFKLQSSAEAALQAIKTGQVFLDGQQLQGEWRGRGGGGLAVRQRLKAQQRPLPTAQPEDDTSSRVLHDVPSTNSSRLDNHNTFTDRDQRRENHGHSSRRLLNVPDGGGAWNRSRSRSRSRSRRRRRSRNRSPKPKFSRSGNHMSGGTVGGGHKHELSALFASFIYKMIKPTDLGSLGNLESDTSDNPLYIGAA